MTLPTVDQIDNALNWLAADNERYYYENHPLTKVGISKEKIKEIEKGKLIRLTVMR